MRPHQWRDASEAGRSLSYSCESLSDKLGDSYTVAALRGVALKHAKSRNGQPLAHQAVM